MALNLNHTTPIEVSSHTTVNISDTHQQDIMLIPENSHPIYIYSMWAILSTFDTLTVFLALLCIAFVGFNRLSAIPLIIPIFAALANGLDWYAWSGPYSEMSRRAAGIAAYIGWTVQEVGSPLYSYFILERILHGWQRVSFMAIFILLSLSTFLLRFFTVFYLVKQEAMSTLTEQQTLQPIINQLSLGFYTTTAAAESLSAFFLLKTFFSAQKSRRKAMRRTSGVLRHLALSTEIRVATLAGVGITRACVMTPKHFDPVAKSVDVVAIIMQNFFCIVLIFDLLATKLVQMEARCADFILGGQGVGGSSTGASEGRKIGGGLGVRGVMARRWRKRTISEDDSLEMSGRSGISTHKSGVLKRFYSRQSEAEISPATNAVTEVTISEEFRQYMGPRDDMHISSTNPSSGWYNSSVTNPGIGEKIVDFTTIDETMRSTSTTNNQV